MWMSETVTTECKRQLPIFQGQQCDNILDVLKKGVGLLKRGGRHHLG